MPLLKRPSPFNHPDWIFELKYDGFRALAVIRDGGTQLISRNAHPFASFAELSKQIAAALPGVTDTVAGLVRDQDVYRVSHQIRQAGFSDAQVERALDLYKLMIEVLRGAKPHHELEVAGQSVRNENWYQWLGIPPENSYLWTWYPKVGNVDTLVFWRQVRAPVLLVYGEHDQLEPVDESLTKIEASLDGVKTTYAAVIVPNAQHNLTVQPEHGAPFFWWKAAPGLVDLVVAWVRHTAESR